MKIYTRVVIGLDGKILESESYDLPDGSPVALCGSGGGGTTTSTSDVPEWQKPFLERAYQRADTEFNRPINYYPGQTVSQFTPEQTSAQEGTSQRAMSGSPLLGQSQAELSKTMSGSYANPESNPWLKKTYEQAAADVTKTFTNTALPMINKEAGAAGAWGGARQGVAQGSAFTGYAGELSDLATKIYAPAYEAERSRQNEAMKLGPQFAEADYTDLGKLAAVGEEKQSMDQANIDAAIKKYEFAQMEPWQRLGLYSNIITGNTGGTTTSIGGGK
jgi:hypothetical protein